MNFRCYALWLLLLMAGCQKEAIQSINNDNSLQGPYGTWKLVSRENYATNEVFFPDPSDIGPYCGSTSDCAVILQLSPGLNQGIITGHTITNAVEGIFSIDPVSRQMNVLSFGGTKIGEPAWGRYLWDNIHDVGRYSVNATQLRLYLNNKPESLTFVRL